MFKLILLTMVASIMVASLASSKPSPKIVDLFLKKEDGDSKAMFKISLPEHIVDIMKPKRVAYLDKIKSHQYKEAIELINELMIAQYPHWKDTEEDSFKKLLVRCDKMKALIESNRKVEALVEALEARKIADSENVPALNRFLNEYPYTLNKHELLQLPKSANLNDLRRGIKHMTSMLRLDNPESWNGEDGLVAEKIYGHVRQAYDMLRLSVKS